MLPQAPVFRRTYILGLLVHWQKAPSGILDYWEERENQLGEQDNEVPECTFFSVSVFYPFKLLWRQNHPTVCLIILQEVKAIVKCIHNIQYAIICFFLHFCTSANAVPPPSLFKKKHIREMLYTGKIIPNI